MALETSRRFSQSRTGRRQRGIQPNVRSNTQRRGGTWKSTWPTSLPTISRDEAVAGGHTRQLGPVTGAVARKCFSLRRVSEAGVRWTVAGPLSYIGGNHVVGAVAHDRGMLSVPPELERQFGFLPQPQAWWCPPSGGPGRQSDSR